MTRLPSHPRRAPVPQFPNRVRPKTYSVAVYLVAAVVLLQVGMLISVFWLRAMVVSVNVRPPKPLVIQPAPNVTPEPSPIGPISPNPSATASKAPEMASLPGLASTAKQPALLAVPAVSDQLEQVGTLNDEAQILLHQNDLKNACQELSNAEDIDPRNPTTLKNLAETYYLMNDSVRAKEYWQRLVDLGPGVGTVYALAKDHVLLLNSTADANTLAQPSPLHLHRDVYIDQVEKTPVETVNGQPQFHLRTVLMRRNPKAPFDQKRLQVYVIFYQQMPDGRFLPDLSQHKGAFEDTFLFRGDKLHEPFGVDYFMPTSSATGADKTSGEYYGFVIGIYYDKVLQDGRSEPTSLITRVALPEAIE